MELRPKTSVKKMEAFRIDRHLMGRVRAAAKKRKVTVTSMVEVALERLMVQLDREGKR